MLLVLDMCTPWTANAVADMKVQGNKVHLKSAEMDESLVAVRGP